jgi:predicted metal-binding protein
LKRKEEIVSFELHLQKYNFKEYKEFDLSLIRIDQAVRNLCRQNACGQYGKNHMCPPAIKDIKEWEKEILAYKNGIIVTKVYQTKNSFDMKGMFEGMADFQKTLVGLKKDLLGEFPEKRLLLLGAGSCSICKKCTYMEGEPCRFPEKAFPSVEACGIDVMSLSKTAGVKYNNGRNTVTYIGVILY